ncbi:hypothetical protein [Blastococcus sp. SYSU DS0617]
MTHPVERLPGLRLVVRRLWWVVVGGALGLGLGLGLGVARPPVYEATAYLTVSSPAGSDPTSLARAAQALARLATSPGIVSDPLEAAGLPDAAEQPRRFIAVAAAPDAPVISITGTATDPETAQRLATTVGRALSDVSPFEPFEATLVGGAPLPAAPTVPGWVAPVGGVGVGSGIALVLAATVPAPGAGRRTPLSARR